MCAFYAIEPSNNVKSSETTVYYVYLNGGCVDTCGYLQNVCIYHQHTCTHEI